MVVRVLFALVALVVAVTVLPTAPPGPQGPRTFTGLEVSAEVDVEAAVNAVVLSVELGRLAWLTWLLGLPQNAALLDRATRELYGTFSVDQRTNEALARYLAVVLAATLSRCSTDTDEALDLTFLYVVSASQLLLLMPSQPNQHVCYVALPSRRGGALATHPLLLDEDEP